MKLAMVLLTVIGGIVNTSVIVESKLADARSNYARAVSDKEICKKMMGRLDSETGNSVLRAYLGAFNTVWAKHAFNPFTKLRSFNRGKKYIEEAVRQDPHNIEIRFIRLSVQKNCPSFLGYHGQVLEDTRFLEANIDRVSAVQLKEMIVAVLKN